MTTACDLYALIATSLADRWQQDALMGEHDPETWAKARVLDDWLVNNRENDTISLGEYRMKCMQLRDLYTPPVAQAEGA